MNAKDLARIQVLSQEYEIESLVKGGLMEEADWILLLANPPGLAQTAREMEIPENELRGFIEDKILKISLADIIAKIPDNRERREFIEMLTGHNDGR